LAEVGLGRVRAMDAGFSTVRAPCLDGSHDALAVDTLEIFGDGRGAVVLVVSTTPGLGEGATLDLSGVATALCEAGGKTRLEGDCVADTAAALPVGRGDAVAGTPDKLGVADFDTGDWEAPTPTADTLLRLKKMAFGFCGAVCDPTADAASALAHILGPIGTSVSVNERPRAFGGASDGGLVAVSADKVGGAAKAGFFLNKTAVGAEGRSLCAADVSDGAVATVLVAVVTAELDFATDGLAAVWDSWGAVCEAQAPPHRVARSVRGGPVNDRAGGVASTSAVLLNMPRAFRGADRASTTPVALTPLIWLVETPDTLLLEMP
jgi:hypothetical protein